MLDDMLFVKVTIFSGDYGYDCWGFSVRRWNIIPIWCDPKHRDIIESELGSLTYLLDTSGNGLTPAETDTVVGADDTNTPPAAWAALAYYRMTGKITPELCEPDLTKAPTNEEHT